MDSMDIYGYLWISMDSMDIMESMDLYGFHGYLWIQWKSIDSWNGIDFIDIYSIY